jgi:hypothetical protein
MRTHARRQNQKLTTLQTDELERPMETPSGPPHSGWVQPCAAANPAWRRGLQSLRPVGRVAELGSLIWLKSVKRAVLLLSESFHFFFRLLLHRLLDRVRDRNSFPAVINAEMRESTRGVCTPRSYQQNTVRRGVLLSLGTRVGFHTASNDHQAFRLTGSLSLARSSLAGFGFHVFLFLISGLGLCSAAFRRLWVLLHHWSPRAV